ncbi:helix-turn-helix domain-containing protein [Culicoidibacter larvae]|uniref:Helix-turn-helix transcriptional regulator n=1 Tax=Culicoidibacter larvae TaxID=2579976 RepID=A0A5R8QCT0_9FIRM|nr:helix-turn-helix transcriptional regulator [Culicoidibacter larvae]TLG74312.1 helix-turn-helix transcriptional regulator [Culicoidibacter larvae]
MSENLMIGKKIKQERVRLQLTQKQLASQLNVSDKTISRWERSDGYPDITLLPLIASSLNMRLEELFNEADTISIIQEEPVVKSEYLQLSKKTAIGIGFLFLFFIVIHLFGLFTSNISIDFITVLQIIADYLFGAIFCSIVVIPLVCLAKYLKNRRFSISASNSQDLA